MNKRRWSYSANGCWMAEFRKIPVEFFYVIKVLFSSDIQIKKVPVAADVRSGQCSTPENLTLAEAESPACILYMYMFIL